MSEDYPRTLLELEQRFSDDEACAGYLASVRWPAGWVIPRRIRVPLQPPHVSIPREVVLSTGSTGCPGGSSPFAIL